MTKLYISYGSNLNKAAMRSRCPDARPRGKFMLTKARLLFRGVADVEYDPDQKVPCGLWEISREDERKLDLYEGVSSGFYFKNEGIVLKYEGERRNALIYMMSSEGVYPPSASYIETIRQGYRDFKLDESYLDAAIKHSFVDKAPDIWTEERRVRQKKTPRHRRLVEMPEALALRRLELRRKFTAAEEGA